MFYYLILAEMAHLIYFSTNLHSFVFDSFPSMATAGPRPCWLLLWEVCYHNHKEWWPKWQKSCNKVVKVAFNWEIKDHTIYCIRQNLLNKTSHFTHWSLKLLANPYLQVSLCVKPATHLHEGVRWQLGHVWHN